MRTFMHRQEPCSHPMPQRSKKCLRNRNKKHESSGTSELLQSLVPKKGLEPPHPCGYMDLNHARLPIPPLRRTKRTSQTATRCVGNTTIVQVGLVSVQCWRLCSRGLN